jgi:predicted dehydrogenase
MAIDLTPEQRETGTANYVRTTEGLTRRGFLKSMAIAGAAVVPTSAAVFFGYESLHGRPVKAALIGGGDEGGVLVGEHNPEFLEFVAVCDIRPSNMTRIFDGDPKVPQLRKGFKRVYGANAGSSIRKYTDYLEMLKKETDIEAVVIATPLFWHARMAIDAMKAGKDRGRPIHVLCEKLMGWNVSLCKKMIRTAEETGSILSIGHQRHYSMLYAHATEILKNDVLGDIKYISALWHRNNAWPYKPDDKEKAQLVTEVVQPFYKDGWFNPILREDYDALSATVTKYGFDSVEQLIRWRCYNATGGGLMAELGSHQLDACSIFLGHVHPLAVSGVGGKYFYGKPPASGETNDYGCKTNYNDRDSDDHVFLTYEFPGKNHPRGPNKGSDDSDLVVVAYSSINTNQFESYGECVKGARGTMIVDQEKSVFLYAEKNPYATGPADARAIAVGVDTKPAGKPALDSSSTWGPAVSAGVPGAGPTGAAPGSVVSRGYREEMEDFAFCVRQWQKGQDYYKQRLPRCHGQVAMVDAVIALTANQAMRKRQRIEFDDAWFDPKSSDAPDGDAKPKIDV